MPEPDLSAETTGHWRNRMPERYPTRLASG
jgi:hypothetical protein